VLPAIGRAVCGQDYPYSYLPASVGEFPPPAQLRAMMQALGYADCAWKPYTLGIAGLFTATRPENGNQDSAVHVASCAP
jgi:demethylmenaquinone methyltransferase/2-methoxy-6-polyprenyl-1,4-benzoquinol methylase